MTRPTLTARLVYQSDAKKVFVVDASPPVSVRFSEEFGVWVCMTCCAQPAAGQRCAHVAAAKAADAATSPKEAA